MTTERFELLLDQLDKTSLNTLKEKNRKYTAESGDALHNFRVGSALDGSTMPQTIWHYWKKHFTSLMDKIQKDDWNDKEDALEKIQDSINYLRFIWCAINDTEEEEHNCEDCVWGFIGNYQNNWDEEEQKIIKEPCKYCKNNIFPDSEEYKDAPLYFVKKTTL